jgi:hypothetical protein
VESGAPGAYPEPPAGLPERRLPLREIVNPAWYRGHPRAHGPLHFNRVSGRFASPDGQAFGTLYVGEDEFAAFIEAFNQGMGSTPLGLFISQSLLASRCLCAVTATRPLRLVDLTSGASLKRLSIDADSRIGAGPHVVSRRWASALWSHPDQPDGLIYLSRHAPDHRSIALFDRTADALVAACAENLLLDPRRVGAILEHFGCALLP